MTAPTIQLEEVLWGRVEDVAVLSVALKWMARFASLLLAFTSHVIWLISVFKSDVVHGKKHCLWFLFQ